MLSLRDGSGELEAGSRPAPWRVLGYALLHPLHLGVTFTPLLPICAPDASTSFLLSLLGSVVNSATQLLWAPWGAENTWAVSGLGGAR